MKPAGGSMLRNELEGALRTEIDRLELTISRTWQAVSLMCAVGGALVWWLAELRLGLWCLAGGAAYLAWFSLEAALRKRGRAGRGLVIGNILVESSMPWTFMLGLAYTEGAAYALASWLPPLLYASMIIAATARLRPSAPLVLGLSGALLFMLAYFGMLRGMLPPAQVDQPLYTPLMQLTRALSLAMGGALAMLVARALRRAIGRADGAVRQDELFGKYRIERQIASGGMGTVHEARYCPDGGFERRVAIKRIHPHLARQERFIDAFRREAELCSMLAHPNIVQVLDFGRAQGTFFLAMEFIDGLTLAAVMGRFRMAGVVVPPPIVAYLARELLAGLAYSHAGARDQQGSLLRVVHRDLSPHNVLLSKNGEVKITDFGVARALRDAAAMDTQTVVGHSAYMAPEQARAQPLDERCDIFSLGIVLWELLCGRSLFDRGGDAPTMLALVYDPVPRPSALSGCDVAWDQWLLRALDRDPDQRHASAAAMADALEALGDAQAAITSDAIAALVERAQALPASTRAARVASVESELPTRELHRAVT